MIKRAGIATTFCVLILAGLTGCKPPCPPLDTIVPASTVVWEYNQNAEKVPRLWTRAKIALTMKLKSGLPFVYGSTSPLADPNGLLILNKPGDGIGPQDFVLLFREAGNELARIGISMKDGVYYSWNTPTEQCWLGRLAFAGAPGVAVPVDPVQILSVLGVCQLPADQTAPPFVAQTISKDPSAQVLTYVDRQPLSNNLLFRREMYFRWQLDPKNKGKLLPRRLFMVKLLDNNGLAVMTAHLKNYKEIELLDVDDEDAPPPIMPTDIRLKWHETGDEIHIVLTSPTTADKVDPEAFLFWDRLPGGLKGKARMVDYRLGTPKKETESEETKESNK